VTCGLLAGVDGGAVVSILGQVISQTSSASEGEMTPPRDNMLSVRPEVMSMNIMASLSKEMTSLGRVMRRCGILLYSYRHRLEGLCNTILR